MGVVVGDGIVVGAGVVDGDGAVVGNGAVVGRVVAMETVIGIAKIEKKRIAALELKERFSMNVFPFCKSRIFRTHFIFVYFVHVRFCTKIIYYIKNCFKISLSMQVCSGCTKFLCA